MKDLTIEIEEKAKRYDEAIERAYSLLNGERKGDAWIYRLFPELKESEDERIRKYIMDIVKRHCNGGIEYKKCITWLEKQGEKNELKKIEQKPAWSEGDEDYYDAIITKLEVTQEDASLTDNQMDFLKSLKDRMTWRPTEEQMEALADAIESYCGTCRSTLNSLYNNLKKL